MTDQAKTAPERINLAFGHTESLGRTLRMWETGDFGGSTEYVRADLLAEAERRGAERMRERAYDAVEEADWYQADDGVGYCDRDQALQAIRALPLTEKDEADDN